MITAGRLCLYVSVWAKTPEDTTRSSATSFVRDTDLVLPPLPGVAAPPAIPVYMDLATAKYLNSRSFTYRWDQYQYDCDDGSKEWRIRITGVDVVKASGNETRIDLSWDDFFARYMQNPAQFNSLI
jgi:hypothetical protein